MARDEYESKFRKSDRLIDRALMAAAESKYTTAIVLAVAIALIVAAAILL